MKIEQYLKEFWDGICDCPKTHGFNIAHICIEKGAIEKLPEFIIDFRAKNPFVLADKNTFEAAGKKVCAILENASISYKKYVFSTWDIEPDEKAIGSAIMHFDNTCDLNKTDKK